MSIRAFAFVLLALAGTVVVGCDDDNKSSGSGTTGDGDGDTGDGDGDTGDGDGDTGDGDGDTGDGDGDGDTGDGDGTGCDTKLKATIRDFHADGSHEDFENDEFMNESGNREDKPLLGIVEEDLGDDKKPVYAGDNAQTTSKELFDQWYHDVDGVNEKFEYEIELTAGAGTDSFVYDNDHYFPIDGKGFGDEGKKDTEGDSRNFAFTSEVHTTFEYKGGEHFTFNGDDDLWLFINGKLAIDLGGLHPKTLATVDLDEKADYLGIKKGNRYDMDIFHAERHTTDSTFHIETTIGCFVPPVL